MLQVIGFIFALLFWFAAMSAQSEQRKKLLEWAVPLAVQIAAAQGWVSPHRLINQLNLTRSDAQAVLAEAKRLGLLYQAVNGRYYLETKQAHQIIEDGMSDFATQLQVSAAPQITIDVTRSDTHERSRSNVAMIISFLIAVGFLGWFLMTYRSSDAANAPGATQSQVTTDTQSTIRAETAPATERKAGADTKPATPAERGAKRQKKERRRSDAPPVPNVHP